MLGSPAFASLGLLAYRRRWWVLGVWAGLLVAGLVAGPSLFGRLTNLAPLRPDAESVLAQQRIEALVADGPIVFAVIAGTDPYDQGVVRSVSQAAEQIRLIDGVVDVDDLYTSPGGLIGADNNSTLVRVELAESLTEERQNDVEDQVRARLSAIEAPTVLVGGDHLAERAFGDQALRDLAIGETLALALLVLILIAIFGGVLGAVVPLAVAGVAVSTTLLVLFGVSTLTRVGEYSVNIVTLLGLGLAVDYALLIVSRFREERAAGADLVAAIETSMARAGRAVAVSGLAVAMALAGLLAFAEPLLASMAVGGVLVVLVTTLLALTAVPALLGVAGEWIPPAGVGRWRGLSTGDGNRQTLLVRLAGLAQRRAVLVAVATTAGLTLAALPLTTATFANSDARSLPTRLEERRAYDSYQSLFGAGEAAPVTLVAEVDATSPQLRDFLDRLNRLPGVLRLDLRRDVPVGAVIIDLIPVGATVGDESRELVRSIRAMPAGQTGFEVKVTGEAAKVVDYQESVGQRLPLVVIVVVLAMLGLLFLLTRSVVVPVKAVLLAGLTFAASLGILVALFDWGLGEPILRFTSWGALDLTTPLLLFVFIFGLSMDYEVFLLARIKEEYDRLHHNDLAVLAGIARSGPVVTAAALCITVVFAGFAAGSLVAVKEIGVGMAVAIIVDVTVVRGLLLPAVMTLLGDLNWWSPQVIRRASSIDVR